jgi:hypothetical protein
LTFTTHQLLARSPSLTLYRSSQIDSFRRSWGPNFDLHLLIYLISFMFIRIYIFGCQARNGCSEKPQF